MKNKLINYLITIVVAIIAVELLQFGFHLMNQPDSLLFYIGLTLIGLVPFFIGWFIANELMKVFTKDEKKSEENDGNKE
jgi:drug/metabolite transporter (DMT)-like permease